MVYLYNIIRMQESMLRAVIIDDEDHETGILVPVGDPERAAQAAEQLIADPALRELIGVRAGSGSFNFELSFLIH